jgi:hypothetical protein
MIFVTTILEKNVCKIYSTLLTYRPLNKIIKSIVLIINVICFYVFFFFDATDPIWALAYLDETLRFISIY